MAPGATPVRGPSLLTPPRLISEPGKVDVEIYSNAATDVQVQFVAYFAVPIPLPPGMQEFVY